MEDIIELIAGTVSQLISGGKYKYAKHRRWTITGFFLILGAGIVAAIAYGVWKAKGHLIPGGEVVLWGLVAVIAMAWLAFVIIGHRKNWPESWL